MTNCIVSQQIAEHAEIVDTTPDISILNVETLINAALAGALFVWSNPANKRDTRIASKSEADNDIRENYNYSDPIFALLQAGDAIAAQSLYDQTIDSIIRETIISAVEDTQQWPDNFDFDFYLGSDAA